MPPKKKAKVTAPPGEARTTRASARKAAEAPPPTPPPTTAPKTATNGQRKRTAATMDAVDKAVEVKKPVVKKSTPAKKSTTTKKVVIKGNSTEKWFDTYADPDSGQLDPESAQKWMSDLGIHPEGVFLYFIMYKCQVSTPMSITKEEFTRFMNTIKVKSNGQLLAQLPSLLDTVRPRVKPEPNPAFKPFYKWCFEHFRPENAKNIDVEVAGELFKVLLDEKRYNLDWEPSEAVAAGMPTPGEFPHVNAFVEFITTEPRPVAVITRDQYDQFYHFNMGVSWSLKEHSEESAWPALLDKYVNWKKEKFPSPKTSVVQVMDYEEL
ncbi:Cullin binding-domain-containing protein [Tricharina praecox]|uniref:Cullin binding-domain-containing protein n=1 Tax=Tricharina praecox TaxID=43433 RepID=UPI00221EC3D4|nr:Cullin binding-domain-containing protein [Tricharina praecox]KAI5848280.1 Cullin binding-domain-containing protein [Tricharina praecox]